MGNRKNPKNILITGGAGFIGVNAANYFLKRGYRISVLDNLSRRGSRENLAWLQNEWGKKIDFIKADVVKDADKLKRAIEAADAVLHLAGQVAVTFSVENPAHDFSVNALGTLNVLEAIRKSKKKPALLYSSTNKVYGNIAHVTVELTSSGYRYPSLPLGVAEHIGLDFHSPYGCSKGAADQYVRDYARIYGLKTVVFRQSCIYGPHQYGIEDQGWVAWFTIAASLGRPITIYGDGHQVRDVLHVDDLCRLYEMAIQNMGRVSGHAYNIGGGPYRVSSVRQALQLLEVVLKKKINYNFGDWRPGDQKVYISDISRIKHDLGWEPKIDFPQGLAELAAWVQSEDRKIKMFFK
jgi:CDP-paratose 2-epimerase